MSISKRGGRALVLTAILATATACTAPSTDDEPFALEGDGATVEDTAPMRPDLTDATPEPTLEPEPTVEPEPTPEPEPAGEPESAAAPEPSVEPEPAPEPAPTTDRAASSSTSSRSGDREATPTPTPSTTPTSAPTNEPVSASTPSIDRPTATTTGVPSGTSLTSRAGGTLNDDGAVFKNTVFTGDVLASGDNQTFVNVRFEGLVRVTGSGTTITRSELGSLVVSGAKDFRASKLDVHGYPGKDGLHVTSDVGRAQNVVIEHSRIHSPDVKSKSHYDGIQVRGVDGLTLRGNSFELGAFKPQYTASIFLENANGGNTDVSIDGNYIDGGGYAVYLGGRGTTFTNNTFGPSANWGLYYPDSDMSSVTVSGNTGPDGRPADS